MLSDNVKARRMLSDGTYALKEKCGEERISQEVFIKEAQIKREFETQKEEAFIVKIKKFFAGLK